VTTHGGHGLGRREWLLGVLAAVGGCGVSSGGTGVGAPISSYVVGTITGFGSVIVNGVRYDESSATITSDDGRALAAAELKLGMRTTLTASAITTGSDGVSRAEASSIEVRSDIVGPVESIDGLIGLVVLGQTVEVVASTVFDERMTTGLSALVVGDVVEIHAVFDAARRIYVATRIERVTGVAVYKLRGVIDAVSIADRTLRIGAAVVDWSAVAPSNPSMALAPGGVVRVTLATTRNAAVWRATSLSVIQPMLADREHVEVEGRVTAFTSASRFEIEGLPVDASTAAFPNGSAAVVLGAKLEVEGSVRGGVIVAQVVSAERDDNGSGDFELHGVIESADAAARSFVVRGITVIWTAATRFDSSTAADIIAGRRVEVRGPLSAGGTRLAATLVHVER
jgi:Domain of unknown function (DUF5666)